MPRARVIWHQSARFGPGASKVLVSGLADAGLGRVCPLEWTREAHHRTLGRLGQAGHARNRGNHLQDRRAADSAVLLKRHTQSAEWLPDQLRDRGGIYAAIGPIVRNNEHARGSATFSPWEDVVRLVPGLVTPEQW